MEGPGFNSTPDIINSFCVTFDKTNRYDNMINDSIAVFVFNLFPEDIWLKLHVDFFPGKVPILDLYWPMSIDVDPMMPIFKTNSQIL